MNDANKPAKGCNDIRATTTKPITVRMGTSHNVNVFKTTLRGVNESKTIYSKGATNSCADNVALKSSAKTFEPNSLRITL
jgi:hypothetical protein